MSLMLEIARCPIAAHCIGGEDIDHPCSRIVRSQSVDSIEEFQSPEPWSGRISKAPILFLSSNPSIGPAGPEEYPRAWWVDDSINDHFENRFGGSPRSTIVHGINQVASDGTRARRGTQFWISVRKRAAELLEISTAEVVAGDHYVLSEVVHCKSRGEEGVNEALWACAERYLTPLIRESVAHVIVCFGDKAAAVLRRRFDLDPSLSLCGPIAIEGRQRYIAFLPHPNRRGGKKSFEGCLEHGELKELKA